ncbi:MAG TPA: preprotein translocase subunit SecG, partial [Geobacterales bacterium]|nr:preprotein translocase subunit SecG [Geobacterales bacterium]
MHTFIVIIHVAVCFGLIGIVLIQAGKGAEIGASFGSSGGSQSIFGASGSGSFLSRVTTAMAVIFMLTSLTLAYFSGNPSADSLMKGAPPVASPAAPAVPPPA